jgi:prolyl-tRNA editing enzyme YbaK/EbsC (Cys-tRNA(Pro) deacylase)
MVTSAIRVLREHGIAFSEHLYRYEERGGTRVSSRELGVDEHCVIKTLVMQDDRGRPLIVLMHGDREVSTKKTDVRASLPTRRRGTAGATCRP